MKPAAFWRRRLKRPALALVLTRGQVLRQPVLTLRWLALPSEQAGVAVIIPVKVAKLASQRHRLKRRFHHAFRLLGSTTINAYGLACWPLGPISQWTWPMVQKQVQKILQQAKLS